MVKSMVILVATLVLLSGCLGGAKDKIEEIKEQIEEFVPEIPNSTVEPEPIPALPHYPNDGAKEIIQITLPSFDAHTIYATVHKPVIASNTTQVPVILHSHGFTGSRTQSEGAFEEFMKAGFAVVSFDERGHGASYSDSTVQFMNPEFEVKDIQILIDEIATWDWVLMEGEADPYLGAIGGSYGGAYQIMGAIFDDRFDSIQPDITWFDITHALAPNGAPKSGWIGLFYIAGNGQRSAAFGTEFHQGFAWVESTNTLPTGQGGVVPDLVGLFNEGSHMSYPGQLTIPAFYTQGIKDTLFNFNQAYDNYNWSVANGADARLYTHLGGHILNARALAGSSAPDLGLQSSPGGYPCGSLASLGVEWHLFHILGVGNLTGPRFCLAVEDGTAIVGDEFPLQGTTVSEVKFPQAANVQLPAGVSSYFGDVPVVRTLPALTATEDTYVVGIPRLTGKVTCAVDCISYWGLTHDGGSGFTRLVDDQIMPHRVTGPATDMPFSIDLGGVTTLLKSGDGISLEVTNFQEQYAFNAGRIPGAVVYSDLVLELPVLPASSAVLLENYGK